MAGWNVLYLVTNAIEVIAGYFLWNARKIDGVLTAIGITASGFLSSLPVLGNTRNNLRCCQSNYGVL